MIMIVVINDAKSEGLKLDFWNTLVVWSRNGEWENDSH